jgi:hypothetical protein
MRYTPDIEILILDGNEPRLMLAQQQPNETQEGME